MNNQSAWPSRSPWPKLDRALQATGFTGFQLSGLASQNLASLEKAVASVRHQFVEVTENREWDIIAQQLAILQDRAQYIALRPYHNHLDIVIGKQPTSDLRPGERYVDAERSYVMFVQDLLEGLYPAAQVFTLSEQAKDSANHIFDTAGPLLGSDPRVTAAVAGVKLVVPFLRLRGAFRCVVVVSAGGVQQELVRDWKLKALSVFPALRQRASAQSWIWDTTTDEVYDTNATLYWDPDMEISGLRSAAQLESYLRNTG